ncbi:MAG: autotransporter assembly complex family protein [Pseudomonadota bacterium]
MRNRLRIAKRILGPELIARAGARRVRVGRRRLFSFIGVAVLAGNAGAAVNVEGLSDAQRDNVLAHLGLNELACDTPQWQVRRRFRRIEAPVRRALEALGYYRPDIQSSLAFDDTCWQIAIVVDSGEPARYDSVRVRVAGDGAQDAQIQSVFQAQPRSGDVVHHGRYTAYKNKLLQALAARGFLDYDVKTSQVIVDEAGERAALSLVVDSGERYRIGAITLNSNAYDDSLLQRFVTLKPGDFYDSERLLAQQRRIAGSELFANASVNGDFDNARDGVINVDITLDAVTRLGYFAGVGVTSDRGPRVSAGYRNRRVNGRGHQFQADGQHSQVLSRLSTRYRMPLADPLLEWQTLEALVEREDTDTSESDSARIGIERTRALDRNWLLSYGLRLGRTRFTVSSVEDSATLFMPVVSANRRVADNDTFPRRGHATDIRLRAASDSVLSTTSFVQAYARHKRVWPVGERSRFSLRGEFGITWRDELDELPPDIRFFAGGDDSVRGYGFESLGPSDEDGEVIGGSRLVTISAEYEHAIAARFSLAAFVDAGNAFNSTTVRLKQGAGVGLVWRSPVGPLRVYVGKPIGESGSPRLHVRFGADL